VLVEVPANCQLRADDIAWAFSGLVVSETTDTDTGETTQTRLIPATDTAMLRHFGVSLPDQPAETSRFWQTVTPVVLPVRETRRRMKNSSERLAEEQRALFAVRQALRHASIEAKVASLRVQREPFSIKGKQTGSFAVDTRFVKERLWHVDVGFGEPVAGPLAIGDGRYMGLGLMKPV